MTHCHEEGVELESAHGIQHGDGVNAGVILMKMVDQKHVHLNVISKMILKRKKTCGCCT